jgi:hypothetical protein
MFLNSPGESFGLGFVGITSEPVRPQVGDLYLEVIVSCLYGVRDIDSPWSAPYNADVFAIEPDAGHFMQLSQIEIKPRA